tara:strand:- start:4794 stop:6551 length:1758 start_codon:yes stop_codon:yes gene_type:complete
MVVYKCRRCGYTTNNKSYVRKHLTRVKACSVVLEDIPVVTLLADINSLKYHRLDNITKSPKILQNRQNNNGQNIINNYTNPSPIPANPNEYYTSDTAYKCNNIDSSKNHKNVSIDFVTKKPGETSMFTDCVKTDVALNLLKKHAAGNEKTQPNVSIGVVTKKPPQTPIHSYYENTTSSQMVQNPKMTQKVKNTNCVSIDFVTKIPAETRGSVTPQKNGSSPIVQDFNASKKFTSQPNVSIDENINIAPERSCNNSPINNITGEHENICSNVNFHDATSSDIHFDPRDNYTNSPNNTPHGSYDVKTPVKYYNNYSASPAIHSRSSTKYSPTKLRTTTLRESTVKYTNGGYFNQTNGYNITDQEYEQYQCAYCQKIFQHRQSKYRHEKNCSSKQGLVNKCSRLEEKLEERDAAIEQLKHQMEIILDKVGSEVHNHNHNTTNYTYNIVLNAFGNESTEYINASAVKNILDQGAISSIPKLLQMLHFNPEHVENQNIRIPNRKENIAKIWDGSKWVFHDKQRTITTMTNKAYTIINNHYSEGSNKQVDEFTSHYEDNDRNTIRRINKDTELMILNSATHNIETITNDNK